MDVYKIRVMATEILNETVPISIGEVTLPGDLIIPEKLRDAHWRGFNASMETGISKYYGRIMTTRALHKTEEKIYVDMSFHLAKDENGKVLGSAAIARLAPPRQPAK